MIPALAFVTGSFFLIYSGADGRSSVNLKSDTGEWVFPSDTSETVKVSGPLGETIIEISGGSARITASPCNNQTCVTAGSVRSPGQWSACLPNRVILYISPSSAGSESETDVDAAVW